jgi:sugar O-acyltransferase (sialic acid O-acetyltransferase NeuD family)
VVQFETLAKAYPPDEYRTFIAVSDIQLNRVRSRLYCAVREAGFSCVSCFSDRAFALPSAEHGENLFAQEFTSLQHNVRVGNNVFLSSGTCVGHSSTMEDDCYTGPHAVICGGVTIRRGSFLGANCCILETVTVAVDCIIGAGAVVLKDTEPGQVYVGSPARPTGRGSLVTAGVMVG